MSDTETLLEAALEVLNTADPIQKARLGEAAAKRWLQGEISVPFRQDDDLPIPNRPARLSSVKLVAPSLMPKLGKGGSLQSRLAMLHSLVHTESWAIDLSWDIIARFGRKESMPRDFFTDFVKVAQDEGRHFVLLVRRLEELGSYYGAFPAHDGLWDSANQTSNDLSARLAVEHCVHEARGLDVLPTTISRFRNGGDEDTANLLETVIYPEEITHCAAGVKWFTYLCQRKINGHQDANISSVCLSPENGAQKQQAVNRSDGLVGKKNVVIEAFHDTVRRYFRGPLKPPFNVEARKAAGFGPDWYEPLASREVKFPGQYKGNNREVEGEELAIMATEGFLVPVIDLDKFEEEKEKLIEAIITYGSFRVINHGVPQKLMSDMKASAEHLFELPFEVKQCNTNVIINGGHVVASLYEGLGIYDASSPTEIHNFCSLLDVSSHDREILSTYASKVHDLIVDLASKIAECLGIMSYSFQEWHSHLRMNRYNFTKETIIGSISGVVHTDNSFITILLEDESVDGLEIMDLTGNFVSIDPVPGTFLANMGDIAKIWSNGRFHNVRHRVICKKAMPRTTVALFMLAPKDNKIEPQAKFVDFEHPKLYRSFDYNEYRMLKLSNLSLTEKEHIDVNEAAIMALFTT